MIVNTEIYFFIGYLLFLCMVRIINKRAIAVAANPIAKRICEISKANAPSICIFVVASACPIAPSGTFPDCVTAYTEKAATAITSVARVEMMPFLFFDLVLSIPNCSAVLSANSFGVPKRWIICCSVSPCSIADAKTSFKSRTTSFFILRGKDSSFSTCLIYCSFIWTPSLVDNFL